MAEPLRVLLLGGTAEALELAHRAARDQCLEIITSLAGRTRDPVAPAGKLRRGGFGGAEGLAAYLAGERIDRVIDATHPYARAISAHAVAACARLGVPYLRLERPPWTARPGDHWIGVPDAAAAADELPARGQRAFLALGRRALGHFAQRPAVWYLVRLIDPPDPPLVLPRHHLILARGPFDRDAERALLIQYRIDVVITRNSGGAASYPKIAAARALGLPVIIIARPEPSGGDTVATVDAVITWLDHARRATEEIS